MPSLNIKNKIHKTLDKMPPDQLKSAWQILQSFSNQQKYANIKVDQPSLEKQTTVGIRQLDNGKGTDLVTFLNEIKASYGSKR